MNLISFPESEMATLEETISKHPSNSTLLPLDPINTTGDQMQRLIEELQKTEVNKEAKAKTLETLNAITDMLQSLRNNKLIDANSTKFILRDRKNNDSKNQRLKCTFQNLVKNL